MAEFVIKYGTPGGEILQRVLSADSEVALREQMEQQGYYVFGIKRNLEVGSLLKSLKLKRKIVTDKNFVIFNQEMASLIKSGLPLLQSLELIKYRADNPAFQEVLEDVYQQVKSGTALSDAFNKYPEVFPGVYTASIFAGEKSATLEQVIRRYIAYSKIILSIKTKVTSSLIYPSLLLGLSVAVVGVLIGYVIPKFSDFYEGFGANLPFLTVMLMTLSNFLKHNWFFLIVGLTIFVIVFRIYLKTSVAARIAIDKLKLKLPLMGNVFVKFSISQLTRTLHTLLAGGLPLVNAMDIAANAVSNRLVAEQMSHVSQSVKEGEPLWFSLKKTGLMTHMSLEMVRVGEETGGLEEMLKNISDFYDEEIETKLTNFLAIVEPVMLIVMGVVVATILFAMYYPLLSVISTVR